MKDKKITDYSVSKKQFELKYDANLDLFKTEFTDWNSLDGYYKSENYISHTDGARNWFEKIYQKVKQYTIKSKWKLLLDVTQNKNISVLDIGCGTGDFLKYGSTNLKLDVVGVEPNSSARTLARKKHLTVFEDLSAIKNKQFDVITLWHVLEHVPNYDSYLENIKTLLKPNGVLVVAIPNFNSYDANYYKEHWAAWDVPRHLWHFSKTTMKTIASKYQLNLIHIKPMYFDSFYVSLLSEEYKTGKKNMLKGFYLGLVSNLRAISTKEYSSHIYIFKN